MLVVREAKAMTTQERVCPGCGLKWKATSTFSCTNTWHLPKAPDATGKVELAEKPDPCTCAPGDLCRLHEDRAELPAPVGTDKGTNKSTVGQKPSVAMYGLGSDGNVYTWSIEFGYGYWQHPTWIPNTD